MIKVLATAARTVAARMVGYFGGEQMLKLVRYGAERVTSGPRAANVRPEDGLVRHYVPFRTGIVARTWVDADCVEVAVLRKGNKRGTYQGHMQAIPGGWRAVDPQGGTVHEATGPDVSYLDVEAHLVKRRTNCRTQGDYRWPYPMVVMLQPLPKPSCATCGNDLAGDGSCIRPDLHWTAESLAARGRASP